MAFVRFFLEKRVSFLCGILMHMETAVVGKLRFPFPQHGRRVGNDSDVA